MIFAIFVPLLFALLVPFLSRLKHKIHTGIFVLIVPLGIFLYYVRFIGKDFVPIKKTYSWIPSLGMNLDLYLDGLSLLFILLISGIGTLVVAYSIYYLDQTERLGHFYVYLLMFMAAMLGVVSFDNLFALYTFWELTSISSFLLIGYWHTKERSRYGAQKSMLITIFGGLSMLGGFILLSVIAGTSSIRELIQNADIILNNNYLPLAMGLILLGAFTKSAQFPFHIWLPDAMEAPTPVSAYLHSATMVKAGLYLVARFSPIFSNYEWFFIIISTFGIVTLCWGSYMAVRQTDLKAILAYSTISQLGMIMAMLGFGTEIAVFAAVFHILNHATFKGSLFMVAGIVDLQSGTRDIRKLGGLFTMLPITGTLALFGTFSMAGIPLPFLNGFYSKEMFFESTLQLSLTGSNLQQILTQMMPYLAVFGSIFTFVYSMYLFFDVFGKKKHDLQLPKTPKEAPLGMLIPPSILVLGIITIGLFPNAFNRPFLAHALEAINPQAASQSIGFWHGLNTPFIMSLIVVGMGLVLYGTRSAWTKIYQVIPGKLSFNRVYDRIIEQIDRRSARITNTYMNGSLKTYISFIIGTIVLVTTTYLFITDGFTIKYDNLAEISVIEIVVVVLIVIASIATIFVNHNLAALLITGIVGYGVSILFLIYRAPDLALTQLVIETVSVVLFLLAFYHLPKMRKRDDQKLTKFKNAVIAIGFGTLMTLIGISAHSSNWFEPISDYFLETAQSIGGGTNVVNVILVDMRGLDTLFEITVLGIAALAVFSLIKLKKDKGANK